MVTLNIWVRLCVVISLFLRNWWNILGREYFLWQHIFCTADKGEELTEDYPREFLKRDFAEFRCCQSLLWRSKKVMIFGSEPPGNVVSIRTSLRIYLLRYKWHEQMIKYICIQISMSVFLGRGSWRGVLGKNNRKSWKTASWMSVIDDLKRWLVRVCYYDNSPYPPASNKRLMLLPLSQNEIIRFKITGSL